MIATPLYSVGCYHQSSDRLGSSLLPSCRKNCCASPPEIIAADCYAHVNSYPYNSIFYHRILSDIPGLVGCVDVILFFLQTDFLKVGTVNWALACTSYDHCPRSPGRYFAASLVGGKLKMLRPYHMRWSCVSCKFWTCTV